MLNGFPFFTNQDPFYPGRKSLGLVQENSLIIGELTIKQHVENKVRAAERLLLWAARSILAVAHLGFWPLDF